MRHGRRDGNHKRVKQGLEGIPGVSVEDTADLGNGFPDLLVGWRGRNFAFEVKDPAQPPSARALTPKEQAFRERWKGHYAVVLRLDDCLREMGILKA